MTTKEFRIELENLGYESKNGDELFFYNDYTIIVSKTFQTLDIWLNNHDGVFEKLYDYKSVISFLIKNKWYDLSIVRDRKINNILS